MTTNETLILNDYEHLEPLTAEEQEAARLHFNVIFDEETFSRGKDGIYVMNGVGNYPVVVVPNFEYGVATVDIDLGLELTEENAADMLAYANWTCTFYYKRAGVASAPANATTIQDFSAWNPGETLHFYLTSIITDLESPEAWRLPMRTAHEIRSGLGKIASRNYSAINAIVHNIISDRA